jgi:hypothetical protein
VVDAAGPYFTAIALGAQGRTLGRAVPVHSTA